MYFVVNLMAVLCQFLSRLAIAVAAPIILMPMSAMAAIFGKLPPMFLKLLN